MKYLHKELGNNVTFISSIKNNWKSSSTPHRIVLEQGVLDALGVKQSDEVIVTIQNIKNFKENNLTIKKLNTILIKKTIKEQKQLNFSWKCNLCKYPSKDAIDWWNHICLQKIKIQQQKTLTNSEITMKSYNKKHGKKK